MNTPIDDILSTPLHSGETLFPDHVKMLNLSHAHRLLVYFLRRPDNEVRAPNLERVLRQSRNVHPQYVPQFYQMVSALVQALLTYVRWEESCTLSGAYRKDLDAARQKLIRIICQFENEEDTQVLRLLQGMIVAAP